MKNIGLLLDGNSIKDIQNLAKDAENANFHSVWTTELYRTSFQQIASASQVTKKIKLGTSVALAFVRSPLITALTSLDIDEASGGRLILGLGSGAKRTNENYHGVNFGKPVKKISECIDIIRNIISTSHLENPLEYDGEFYKINTKGYYRAFKPYRENIPIFLAGIGKNMAQAAGSIADGYIGHVVCSYKYMKDILINKIREGVRNSGRNHDDFTISSIICCSISNNKRDAIEAAKKTIAFYATVRTYEPPFKLHGFEKQTLKIRDAYFKRDFESMHSLVTDDMVDAFAVCGNADECRKKIKMFDDYLDLPILSAPHYFMDFEEVKCFQKSILETFAC